MALAALTAACSGTYGPDGTLPAELPLLALSEPSVEIGLLDGPDEYIFATIESVVRLADGTIAVSDAGAMHISLYDAGGTFLRRWGQRGDGPEEFRSLGRLYPHGSDSLMVSERYPARMTVFDLEGTFARRFPAIQLTQDTAFALDSWLYGRYWIDGALLPDARAQVRAALDRLPQPRLGPGYRAVFVDAERRLWIREPGAANDTARWTRTDHVGRPTAVVALPSALRPTHIEGDEVLGVWTGESDVHFVRAHRLIETEDTAPTPSWLLGEGEVESAAPPDEEALTDLMRDAIKEMARAQEIHYASNGSYTSDIHSLERFEKPEDIGVDFAVGSARGWAAVFTHPAVDRVCGLAYGFDHPPGWTPGTIVCGPHAATTEGS
jgi:hypothetical protein